MMKLNQYLALLLLGVLFMQCNKPDAPDLFKSAGKRTTESRVVPPFTEIELHNDVHLTIVPDTFCSVVITCGKNLMPEIKSEVTNNRLILRNKNQCNWVRDLDPDIQATVHVKSLSYIYYKGASGNIYCSDTLTGNSFLLDAFEGNGSVNLLLDYNRIFLKLHTGSSDITAVGKCHEGFIYANSYGPLDCKLLITENMTVINNGTHNCYVTAKNHLNATLNYLGDIYYQGNPDIEVVCNGRGRLISMD